MKPEDLKKIFQYIDTYQDRMVNDLREAVAIKSVSGSYEHNGEIKNIIKWTENWIKKLKATSSERFDIGSYSVDGKTIKLPTVILASFGQDKKKKTICVYCRVDVKNADATNWETDPWTLTEKDKKIYGRGTSKGKLPLVSWFHCIEAFLMQKIPLPVNLKFIIEGMFEMNSFGLEDFLYTQRITFLRNIDYICINESEWMNSSIPCISYGTCGICQYEVICGSPSESQEFDAHGLIKYILDKCVDNLGNIKIPKINDDVMQINPEIEQSLESVECDLTRVKKNLPTYMQNWSKQKILIRLWQFPALFSSDVEKVECTCDGGGEGDSGGDKIKGVKSKFILKIVPVQTPLRCNQFLMEHVANLVKHRFRSDKYNVEVKTSPGNKQLECKVKAKSGDGVIGVVLCKNLSATRPWQENSVSPHYEAAKRACKFVFIDSPSLIKESNDLPIILILEKLFRKNIVLLPLCNNQMDYNYANECISKLLYFEGKKLLASYIAEVAAI